MWKLSERRAALLWLLAAGAVDLVAVRGLLQWPSTDATAVTAGEPRREQPAPRTAAVPEDAGEMDETVAGMQLARQLLDRAGLTLDPRALRQAWAWSERDVLAAANRHAALGANVSPRACWQPPRGCD